MKISKFKKLADQIRGEAGKKDDFLLVIVPASKEPRETEAMLASGLTRSHAIAVITVMMQRYRISPIEIILGPAPGSVLEHMREALGAQIREALEEDDDLPKGNVTRKGDKPKKKEAA